MADSFVMNNNLNNINTPNFEKHDFAMHPANNTFVAVAVNANIAMNGGAIFELRTTNNLGVITRRAFYDVRASYSINGITYIIGQQNGPIMEGEDGYVQQGCPIF